MVPVKCTHRLTPTVFVQFTYHRGDQNNLESADNVHLFCLLLLFLLLLLPIFLVITIIIISCSLFSAPTTKYLPSSLATHPHNHSQNFHKAQRCLPTSSSSPSSSSFLLPNYTSPLCVCVAHGTRTASALELTSLCIHRHHQYTGL